jgi:hypothetical protein
MINFQNNHPETGIRRHSIIGMFILICSVNFLSPGYSFGYGEQMLLSIKGISWADKNAFVGDWFNDKAPQPHVLFDVITYIGEKTHFLAGIYFVYYLASCFAFALGTALLAKLWLPRQFQYLQHFVNILVVVGPVFLLGTFLTIHFQAVPNMAGGCIAYLGLACLLTKNDRLAAFAIATASAIHLQHGIAIASVGLLFVVFGLVKNKRLIIGASLISLSVSFAIAVNRQLLSGSSEIAHAVAEVGSTGHFNVETWPTFGIISGLTVLGLAVLNFTIADSVSHRIRKTFLFAIIMCGPVIGIVSDLNNIEPFQSLARSFFVYRYSMLLAPFACWFIVRQLVIACTAKPLISVASLGVFGFSYYRYFLTTNTDFPKLGSWWLVLIICLVVAIVRLLPDRLRWRNPISVTLFSGLFTLMFTLGFLNFENHWPQIDYSASDNAVILSRSMSTALQPDDVLASDPSIPWIRILTRRAIVADCKGAPYGGEPWDEYIRRLKVLGVTLPNVCVGYKELSLERILEFPQSVGATTVLLIPDDVAYRSAQEQLAIRWSSGGSNPWLIFELPQQS